MAKSPDFSEFPPQSREQWEARITKELKGKERNTMHWSLDEQIVLDALYRQEDLDENFTTIPKNGEDNSWELGESYLTEEALITQRALIKGLEEGVQAPQFIFPHAPGLTDLEQLFKSVELDFISTHLGLTNPGIWPGEMMTTFLTYVQFQNKTPRELKGSISYDPLAGESEPDWKALSSWLKHTVDVLPGFKLLSIDLRDHCQGVDQTTAELSVALRKANTIIAALAEHGITPSQTQHILQFQMAVDKEYLISIAKLRTLRLLVTQLFEAYGVQNPHPIQIEVHFAPQAYDDNPNTNRIRATTLAMSAVIGGCDRLFVLPTLSPELPSNEAFARRLGRNLQHLLSMESHLDQVVDPAAGSYYLETLTNELGEKAWDKFRLSLNE